MQVLGSHLDLRSEDYRANRDAMVEKLEEFEELQAVISDIEADIDEQGDICQQGFGWTALLLLVHEIEVAEHTI